MALEDPSLFGALLAVVAACSLIQSVFGVGLLVFGTPTLLLLGLPFHQTLSYLLPCSLVISALQTRLGWHHIGDFRKDIPLFAVPPLLLSFAIVLLLGSRFDAKIPVGCILILSGLLRASSKTRSAVQSFLSRSYRPFLSLIGAVHGATNMGGGLLAVTVGSLTTNKEKIRANIAYGYLIMGAFQTVLLAASGAFVFKAETILFPMLAGFVFFAFGQRAFRASTETLYQSLITLLILAFGAALLFL